MSQAPRRSIEIEGHDHRDLPIPAASRVGPLVATGGVRGVDRTTGVIPPEIDQQIELMFANLRAIIEAAGASCEEIAKVTIWVKSANARALINKEWIAMFPEPGSRPARHILTYDLPGQMLVQCEALAYTGG